MDFFPHCFEKEHVFAKLFSAKASTLGSNNITTTIRSQFFDQFSKSLAFGLLGYAFRYTNVIGIRHVHKITTRNRNICCDARALRPDWVFTNLAYDFVAFFDERIYARRFSVRFLFSGFCFGMFDDVGFLS